MVSGGGGCEHGGWVVVMVVVIVSMVGGGDGGGAHSAQLFHASATVRHCLTSFKVKLQLDHYYFGDESYIDVHKFIWA